MTTVPVWQLYQRPAEVSVRCVQSQLQHGRQTVILSMCCTGFKLSMLTSNYMRGSACYAWPVPGCCNLCVLTSNHMTGLAGDIACFGDRSILAVLQGLPMGLCSPRCPTPCTPAARAMTTCLLRPWTGFCGSSTSLQPTGSMWCVFLAVSVSVIQSKQSINQAINQPSNQAINQPPNQAVNKSVSQTVNKSVSQSIKQISQKASLGHELQADVNVSSVLFRLCACSRHVTQCEDRAAD